jgi:hypothetical protein
MLDDDLSFLGPRDDLSDYEEHERAACEEERQAASSLLDLCADANTMLAISAREALAAAEATKAAEATLEQAALAEAEARARAAELEKAVAAAKASSTEGALTDATEALQAAIKIVEKAAAACVTATKIARANAYTASTLDKVCEATKKIATDRAVAAGLASRAIGTLDGQDDRLGATPGTFDEMDQALQETVAACSPSAYIAATDEVDEAVDTSFDTEEEEEDEEGPAKPKPKPHKRRKNWDAITDGSDDADLDNAKRPGWKLGVMESDQLTVYEDPADRVLARRALFHRYRQRQIKTKAAGHELSTDLLMAYLQSEEGRQVDPLSPDRFNQITWTLKSENCWFTQHPRYKEFVATRKQYRDRKRNRADETRQYKKRKGMQPPVKVKPTTTKHDKLILPMPSASLVVTTPLPSLVDIFSVNRVRLKTPPPPQPPRRSRGDSSFASDRE